MNIHKDLNAEKELNNHRHKIVAHEIIKNELRHKLVDYHFENIAFTNHKPIYDEYTNSDNESCKHILLPSIIVCEIVVPNTFED